MMGEYRLIQIGEMALHAGLARWLDQRDKLVAAFVNCAAAPHASRFSNSSSVRIFTPSFLALSNLLPAFSPATT
jgi:hypothetical protein